MTEQRPFTYTILRYLHDQRAGEVLNAGIVMYIPSECRLLYRTRTTFGRVKGAFPDLDGRAFLDGMRALDRSLAAVARNLMEMRLFPSDADAGGLARRAMAADDSAYQWSPVGSGLTAVADTTFERLYERLVRRHDGHTTSRRHDDAIWRPVREKLAARDIHVPFEEKRIEGALDSITFQHAWKNGIWHAYEPVSLDLADQDGIMDKARRWIGHLAAVKDAPTDPLKLHFILGAPRDPSLMAAYDRALALLRKADLNPDIFEEAQIDSLVSRIEDEVRRHEEQVTPNDPA